MWEEVKQMAQRALNRLNNVLARGKLNSVTIGKRPVANVSLFNDETYDDIEFANDWGFISYPPIDGNTELIVSFLRGMRDNGTVLRSFNRKYSLKGASNVTLLEGETALYNWVTGNYFLFKRNGDILLKHHTGSYLELKDDDTITLQHSTANNYIKLNPDGSIVVHHHTGSYWQISDNNEILFQHATAGNKTLFQTSLVQHVGKTEIKLKIFDNDLLPFMVGSSTMGQPLTADAVNQIDINANGQMTIKAVQHITIDSPLVTMTGNLKISGDMLDSTMRGNTDTARGMRNIFNDHIHDGVTPGGGVTLKPTSQQ